MCNRESWEVSQLQHPNLSLVAWGSPRYEQKAAHLPSYRLTGGRHQTQTQSGNPLPSADTPLQTPTEAPGEGKLEPSFRAPHAANGSVGEDAPEHPGGGSGHPPRWGRRRTPSRYRRLRLRACPRLPRPSPTASPIPRGRRGGQRLQRRWLAGRKQPEWRVAEGNRSAGASEGAAGGG